MAVKVGVLDPVGVKVLVCEGVFVTVDVSDGVKVAVGAGGLPFVKVRDQTGTVVPTLYMLKVNESPFTVMPAKPCEVPISI